MRNFVSLTHWAAAFFGACLLVLSFREAPTGWTLSSALAGVLLGIASTGPAFLKAMDLLDSSQERCERLSDRLRKREEQLSQVTTPWEERLG